MKKSTYIAYIAGILMICFTALPVRAVNNYIDSLNKALQTQKGNKRIQTLHDLCEAYREEGNNDVTFTWMKRYVKEAEAIEDQNVIKKAYSYYTDVLMRWGWDKEFNEAYADHRKYFEKNHLWEEFYSLWYKRVHLLANIGSTEEATKEVSKMYHYARDNKSDYGVIMSMAAEGRVNNVVGLPKRALHSCQRAHELSGDKPAYLDILVRVFRNQSDAYVAMNDQANSIETNKQLVKLCTGRAEYADSRNAAYRNLAEMYLNLHEPLKAKYYFDKIDAERIVAPEAMLPSRIDLYSQLKYFNTAEFLVAELDSVMVNKTPNYKYKAVDAEAKYFYRLGDFKTSADLLRRAVVLKDSMNNRDAQEQITRMIARYNLDEQVLKNKTKNALLAVAAIIIAMLLIIISKSYTIQKKNKLLYEAIRERLRREEANEKMFSENITAKTEEDRNMYQQICTALAKDQLYRRTDLNREDLAEALGTNTNYIATAIRNCSDGMTVKEFINHYRIRVAAKLIAEQNMPIASVISQTGFNSRSTFVRLFREQYGMSPSDYRSAAAGKE